MCYCAYIHTYVPWAASVFLFVANKDILNKVVEAKFSEPSPVTIGVGDRNLFATYRIVILPK